MSRRVQWSLLAAIAVAALIALAGCGHYRYGERESWRRDAEIACIGSGAAREGPERVRISAIDGPGICGAEYPLRVSALGDTAPLGYDDEPLRPPGVIPESALPKQWVQSNALPPPPVSRPQYGQPQTYPPQAYPAQTVPVQPPPPDAPMSLYAPGIPQPQEDDYAFQPAPPPAYGQRPARQCSAASRRCAANLFAAISAAALSAAVVSAAALSAKRPASQSAAGERRTGAAWTAASAGDNARRPGRK